MYLGRLNNKEKEMFLELSVYASQANGVVEEAEKEMIMSYCKEMSVLFYDVSNIHSYNEVSEFFKGVSKEKKRIVLLELLGLCHCDGEVDSIEDAFSKKFANEIGIDDELYDVLSRDVEEYLTILSIINGHVLN